MYVRILAERTVKMVREAMDRDALNAGRVNSIAGELLRLSKGSTLDTSVKAAEDGQEERHK
jgi:hypothetical protein